MAITPEIRDTLRELALRLDAARHGEQSALVAQTAQFLGWSPQTVYRQL